MAVKNSAYVPPFNKKSHEDFQWIIQKIIQKIIDCLASVWLINRFVDTKARFLFVAEGEMVEGAIGFDLYGCEFTHRGEDCTFETMIRHFGLSDDDDLRELAEIVHDTDLKDNKFNRSEAFGLGAVIRGLAESLILPVFLAFVSREY